MILYPIQGTVMVLELQSQSQIEWHHMHPDLQPEISIKVGHLETIVVNNDSFLNIRVIR